MMSRLSSQTLVLVALCGGLMLSACGGGDEQVEATPLSAPASEGYPIEGGASVDTGPQPAPAEGYPVP